MPTPASLQALQGLRDPSTLKCYVIPLLAIVLYIYAIEIKRARGSGNWEAVFAGLTLFGMDFINETGNGWVFHLTQRSAFWTTPGDTALRTMVGWNIEIMFMFAFAGIWLIFLFGYFHFFVAIIFMLYLKTMKKRLMFIGLIYSIAIALNVVGLGILGFVY